MSSTPTNGGVNWRLESVEHRVDKLEGQNISVLATKLSYVEAELHDVRRQLAWVLRTLVGLSVTILAGALVFAISNGLGSH